MKRNPKTDTTIDKVLDSGEAWVMAVRRFFAGYFWLILKNVLGWLLIILALPAGLLLPGPGGLPMFLIGFALVAFPGKRRITSRFMRGRPLRLEAGIFTTLTTFLSLLTIGILLWFVGNRYTDLMYWLKIDPDQRAGFIIAVAGVCVLAALVTWGITMLALRFVNVLIRLVPRIRRFVRPIMRKWGIVLLPPPKHRRGAIPATDREQTEILEFSVTSKARFTRYWTTYKPWLKRFAGAGVTAALFYYILNPIIRDWHEIEPFVNQVKPYQFVIAVFMFAIFLFVFRVFSWWTILRALGHELPIPPVTRIWSTSELARYLPGVVWQVVGRMYLIKPYGVSGSICSTSQVLELIIFLLANVVVAVSCLLWFGFKNVQDHARWWLIASMCLMPLLFLLLHPKIFYSLMNRIIGWFRKPPIEARVPGLTLFGLLLWNIAGLLFMTFSIWLIVNGPLELQVSKWWVIGGAYCLAWCAGFLAIWAPGGLGVREVVFMTVVVWVMPPAVRAHLENNGLRGFANLLAIVLRIWATAGELIVCVTAYMLDIEGALKSFQGNRKFPDMPRSTPSKNS